MVLRCVVCVEYVGLERANLALVLVFADAPRRSTRVNFDRPVSPSVFFVGSKLVLRVGSHAIVRHSCICG